MADRQNIQQSYTVVASPADDTETVVASVGNLSSLLSSQSFKVHGWLSITAEAAATAVVLKLRRTNLTGTQIGVTLTYAATDVAAAVAAGFDIYASDARVDVSGAVYVMTAAVTTAGGASVVNAVYLEARVD